MWSQFAGPAGLIDEPPAVRLRARDDIEGTLIERYRLAHLRRLFKLLGARLESMAYVECRWTPDDQDACPYCSGEACAQYHPFGERCDHSVDQRHMP